jgi:hypothetical protein
MNVCLNCGTEFTGKFCFNCGQKIVERKDRTLFNFLAHFFNEFFSWDSKFWSSFKPLLFSPGFLSEKYFSGSVASYISPLKLYLCVSLVVFLVASRVDNDVLGPIVEDDSIFKSFIMDKVNEKDISLEEFNEKFTSEIYDKLPIYTLMMLFLFSLPLNIIFINRRKLFVEHLVFSLHFYSFVLISIIVGDIINLLGLDLILIFMFVLPLIYLFFAVKRVYQFNYIVTFLFTGLLSFIFTVLWLVWFFSAFFITLWTV